MVWKESVDSCLPPSCTRVHVGGPTMFHKKPNDSDEVSLWWMQLGSYLVQTCCSMHCNLSFLNIKLCSLYTVFMSMVCAVRTTLQCIWSRHEKMNILREARLRLEGASKDRIKINKMPHVCWCFIRPRENRVLPRCHSDSAMQTLTFSVSLHDIPSKKGNHGYLVNCLKKKMKVFALMPTSSLN